MVGDVAGKSSKKTGGVGKGFLGKGHLYLSQYKYS